MSTLYVVATPIGNLNDITLRALRVLREVGLIAAEDTRVTRKLLSKYSIATPTTSYHEHNKLSKLPYLLKRLEEHDVALVADAGTPGLSDPGYELINAAIERGVNVVPVPGPSVVLTALVASGLPTAQFAYLGFLPRKKGERRKLLLSAAQEQRTMVLFESPHRFRESLSDMLECLGDRRVAVCRELTKAHEEVFRGTFSQALAHFQQPLGEFTLVVEGAKEARQATPEEALDRLRELRQKGLRAREAVGAVAQDAGLPRRELYKLWLRLL